MEDRYLDRDQSYSRLVNEYEKYESLFVAFDFDNTVFDYHNTGDTYPALEKILRDCKNVGFKLILFTANETEEQLKDRIDYCVKRGYSPDYVNESPIMNSKKPYFNILLDDRSGLESSYQTLNKLITGIKMNVVCKQ